MKAVLNYSLSGKADSRQTGTFTVPAAFKQLSLTCDLETRYGFLVFVILKDSRNHIRLQKQLGSGDQVITIGPDTRNTTIGGIPGKIFTGEWTLEVCLFAEHIERLIGKKEISFHFTVSDEEIRCTEPIGENLWADMDFSYTGFDSQRVYRRGARWYKGDLHTHTRLSDDKELPENAGRKAEMMQLDYYIATEHNVVHSGWPETNVCVMPGVEATTILGHANIFGLTKRPEELERLLYDKEETVLADLLWADGHRICAIGGSDSHNLLEERYGNATEPSIPGDPATWPQTAGAYCRRRLPWLAIRQTICGLRKTEALWA